jgi:hypothetical protein
MSSVRRVQVLVGLGMCLTVLTAMVNGDQASAPAAKTDMRQSAGIFEGPDLVAVVSITDKSQTELTGIDGQALNPPRVQRLAMARVEAVLRVNKRSAAIPGPSLRYLVLNLDSELDLAVAESYFLMLNFIRKGPVWPWASKAFPAYAMARENPGFEVDDGNVVHALRRTPESMPYDGKAFSDLVKAIEGGRQTPDTKPKQR